MRQVDKINYGHKIIGFFLTFCLITNIKTGLVFANVNADTNNIVETISDYYNSTNYNDNILFKNIDDIVIDPTKNILDNTSNGINITNSAESFNYGKPVLSIDEKSTLQLEVTVPKDGGYNFYMDYYIPTENYYNLKLNVKINDEYQFTESKSIEMKTSWKDENDTYSVDDFGNDEYPKPTRNYHWEHNSFNNIIFNLKTPYIFNLKSGKNIITIENNDISYLMGDFTISGEKNIIDYATYKKENQSKPVTEFIVIEGEKYSEKSEPYIMPTKTKDQNATPYDPKYMKMNYLSNLDWAENGDFITYDFDVQEDGMYYICFKYKADEYKDKVNLKNILIDNKILFNELTNYKIHSSNSLKNEIINVDGENVGFYLEKGTHTLKIQSTADGIFDTYKKLTSVINEINSTSIEIKYITGNKSDKYRDWEIDTYIPTLKDDLIRQAKTIDECYNTIEALSKDGKVGLATNLKIASDNLIYFSEDLNYLVNNMDKFSQGSNSVIEYISLVLTAMPYQEMGIEKIYITGDVNNIPKPNVGISGNTTAFFQQLSSSFTIKNDQNGLNDPNKLNIWVNKSQSFIDVMRSKFKTFSEETGIETNISSLGDEQKILLAISAGNGPDMVIGASNYRPFDFALRGAIYDLRQFDDFDTIIEDFQPENFVPFIINDACYALPETVNFKVTYYRKDILKQLNIETPRTWDDAIAILPTLSRYGMSISTPIANAGATKDFGTTIPFIQQNNGKVYADDGSKVELGDPNTVEAFQLMTDLYTRYSLPLSVPSFYNSFKRGVTPIGISDIQSYFLLTFGSPELTGDWAIAPSIGIEKDGSINSYQASVSSCSLILESSTKKEDAWKALKWWMSEDAQTDYSNQLLLRYGPKFINISANMKAFENNKVIPQDIKDVLREQLNNTKEIPRNPAYFEVERELSNAWNNVVFQGYSPRNALDQASLNSNRKIQQKLKEFGYMDNNGNMIKPFNMASGDTVEKWQNKEVK